MTVENKIRMLWAMLVAFVIILGVPVTQATENSYHNCLDAQTFARQYDGYVDTQVQNAVKSPLLDDKTKADRVAQGQHFHAFTPRHCTGIWPFQP